MQSEAPHRLEQHGGGTTGEGAGRLEGVELVPHQNLIANMAMGTEYPTMFSAPFDVMQRVPEIYFRWSNYCRQEKRYLE